MKLREIKKINFIISPELQNLEYEDKLNFTLFFKKHYEIFENYFINNPKNIDKKTISKDQSFSKVSSLNDENDKVTKRSDKLEAKSEELSIEEKINKNTFIFIRKNCFHWKFGLGIIGLIGIGFFFLLTRNNKKCQNYEICPKN